MNEAGLMYIENYFPVGVGAHQRQCDKGGQKSQLKRIAETMGLEPVVASGEMVSVGDQQPETRGCFDWVYFLENVDFRFVGGFSVVMLCMVLWRMWKRIKMLFHDNRRMSIQLADHYDFDVELETRGRD